MEETDYIKINALFGLLHLRPILGILKEWTIYFLMTLCLWSNHVKKSIQVFFLAISHLTTTLIVKQLVKRSLWALWDQPVWELFNSDLGKYVAPSEYLTIDETLYPMQHQIAFHQYSRNKPRKYGVLLNLMNDVRFLHTDKALLYAAKATVGDGPFYISSVVDYIKNLVIRTKEKVRRDGRNISMHCLYTSVEIAHWLLEKNITIADTVQKGRVGFL